jgi:hypothetical protein
MPRSVTRAATSTTKAARRKPMKLDPELKRLEWIQKRLLVGHLNGQTDTSSRATATAMASELLLEEAKIYKDLLPTPLNNLESLIQLFRRAILGDIIPHEIVKELEPTEAMIRAAHAWEMTGSTIKKLSPLSVMQYRVALGREALAEAIRDVNSMQTYGQGRWQDTSASDRLKTWLKGPGREVLQRLSQQIEEAMNKLVKACRVRPEDLDVLIGPAPSEW